MMLRRLSILTLLFVSLGTGSALASPLNESPMLFSQKNPGGPGLGMGPMGKEGQFFQQLNLTPDQKQKIATIRNQYKPQIDSQLKVVQQASQELQTMIANGSDPNQIRQKHQQVMGLRQKLQELHFNSLLDIRQVLTPEQRTQLTQLMQQHRQNRPNRGGGGNPNFNRNRGGNTNTNPIPNPNTNPNPNQ